MCNYRSDSIQEILHEKEDMNTLPERSHRLTRWTMPIQYNTTQHSTAQHSTIQYNTKIYRYQIVDQRKKYSPLLEHEHCN